MLRRATLSRHPQRPFGPNNELPPSSCRAPTTTAHVDTTEGFHFGVRVSNEDGSTFISGRMWKDFARIYELKVGQQLMFTMNSTDEAVRLTTGHYPITHARTVLAHLPCICHLIVGDIPMSCKLQIEFFSLLFRSVLPSVT